MGTAPVELKKESGTQEVRPPAIFRLSSFCVTSHMARISSFLSHATDMMSPSHPTIDHCEGAETQAKTTALGMCACADGCADGNDQASRQDCAIPIHYTLNSTLRVYPSSISLAGRQIGIPASSQRKHHALERAGPGHRPG